MKKSTSGILGVFVAAIFFFCGMFVGPKGSNLKSHIKQWRYTAGSAQKMYDSWEKSALFFESGGESFESFAQKNESFILYFWATWCPHCKNIFPQMQNLKNANIPTVALPFDTDWDSYHLYREKNAPFWQDLVQHSKDGEAVFVPRKDAFDIPLIPSVWIIKNGKVQKIFVGESGAKKFFSYLEKQKILSAQ